MSGSAPPVDPIKRRDFYVMVPHIDLPAVLMTGSENRWSLPVFAPDERSVLHAGHINRSVKKLLGLDATVLRCLYYFADREVEMRTEAAFAMENHSPGWQPPEGVRWVGRDDLHGLELSLPSHRALIEEHLAEVETGVIPPQRQPWAREGWLPGAEAWIRQELERLGIKVTGDVEQDKTWSISCLLRVPTDQGTVYFKAVPAIFAQEPLITKALAECFPGLVPEPLAINVGDPEQSWMLLADIGGVEMRDDATTEQWVDVL
ncbi:MAG TPA: hypothetical protein VM409_07295, partial [Chloroflexia bacterium]|nr:hypothetical protein [Chloroflexia bacterium]